MAESLSVLSAVRSAYAAGLCLLPVAENGSKAPDVSSWVPFKTTRPTADQMRAWDFSRRCGFGVIAGPVSGYVECWDFDDVVTFAAFVETAAATGLHDVVQRIRHGYEDTTPGGGVRWLVRYPADVTWSDVTLARRPGRAGEPAVKTLIELPDIRHRGAELRACPSERQAVCPCQWRRRHDCQLQPSTNARRSSSWRVRSTRCRVVPPEVRSGLPRPARVPVTSTTVAPRGRTSSSRMAGTSSIGATMRRIGAGPARPGAVVSTTNYAGSDLLKVFTSSTPFEPDATYTKFGAYAVLEHGGHYAKAARALAAQGFGDTPTSERVAPSSAMPPRSPARASCT